MKATKRTIFKKHLFFLFLASFLVRAITFHFFITPQQRYRQADSPDYHNCTISMYMSGCMNRIDTMEPIYWRTPGYPTYLYFFYKTFAIETPKFDGCRIAQIMAIWLQILLSSLVPIILLYLALMLTGILSISWVAAWIYALHLGPILASCFLLTEALAIIFFSLFLFFFYKQLRTWFDPPLLLATSKKNETSWKTSVALASLFLGIATWIRPMGEFVLIVAVLLIFILDRVNLKVKFKKIGLIFFVFFAITGPWYIRNYRLTGKFFFCPMFGPYLNSFCAPKILRDTLGIPLPKCIHYLYNQSKEKSTEKTIYAYKQGKKYCKLFAPLEIALPIIKKHPFVFLHNWTKEVLKTTFDLYSSQLVAFANNSFMYDPLEEFLTEKWAACVYKQKMPFSMRLLIFLEIIFELFKWIGLLCGAWLFLLRTLIKKFQVTQQIKQISALWLKTAPMIGAFLFMTGGFGYARLRLPVEPLMILLSLTFWYFLIIQKREKP